MSEPIFVHGDCLDVLRTLDANSVDAIVTDPPYELGFMGKRWDASGIAYNVDLWRECLRVLKPGGHQAAFGGTRTYHRMTCAIEDAGFEIRDSLLWLYGTGKPPSKAHLRPSYEPIALAHKPGPVALNIEPCRTTGGRWPANVLLEDEVTSELDTQGKVTKSQGGSRGAGGQHGTYSPIAAQPDFKPGYGDTGGPSRFFPAFRYQAKAPSKERPRVAGVAHPTVKPLDLMRWLVRLVTPPGGLVLDPFAGSGTTLQAARDEGFDSFGIEREWPYFRLICARLGVPDPGEGEAA